MINVEQEVLIRAPKPRVIIKKSSAKDMLLQMFLVLFLHISIVAMLVIAVSYFFFKVFG